MVLRHLRTKQNIKRIKVVAPGNTVKVHYKKKKPKLGHCHVTGETLKGVPRERPFIMRNLPKTKKRPQRPFGGVLSSRAMREVLKKRVVE